MVKVLGIEQERLRKEHEAKLAEEERIRLKEEEVQLEFEIIINVLRKSLKNGTWSLRNPVLTKKRK